MSDLAATLFAERDQLMADWAEGNITQDTWGRIQELNSQLKRIHFDEHIAKGEIDMAFVVLGSGEVAAAIVELAPALTDEQLRDLLRDEWTRAEAHKPYRADFVELFKRVGFVTDAEGELPHRLRGKTVTVYRGNLGEDEPAGIAWTLNRKTAEFFGRMGMSMRGQLLGMYREDGVPTVWKGKVDTADVLAYFEGRSEAEVVLDPATIRDVHMHSQAVTVPAVDPVTAASLAAIGKEG